MSISIERLSSEDQLMRRWDDRWPQDIGALAILEGSALLGPGAQFRLDAARRRIAERLHLLPRFRQVIHTPRRGLGGPLWIDAPGFALEEHVHALPPPSGGGESGLLALVEALRRERLSPGRPLWEMWFIPGLPGGRIAWFVKLNHAIADGMAAMAALGVFLDDEPDAPGAGALPWSARPPPPARELLADVLLARARSWSGKSRAILHPVAAARQVRAAWPAARDLLFGPPPPTTSLNRWLGRDRAIALLRSDLELFKEIAHRHGATVNDVLLSVTAGGLRALLKARREEVEHLRLPVYVPVSLRADRRGSTQGNQIAQMVVPVGLGAASASDRLRSIAAETRDRKARKHYDLGALFHGEIATRLMVRAINRKPVNVTTANLPGPAAPLSFAGARMLEVFPVIPLIANVSLGVGALSYAGAFNLGIVADRDGYPDLADFVSGAEDELDALARSSSPGPRRERAACTLLEASP